MPRLTGDLEKPTRGPFHLTIFSSFSLAVIWYYASNPTSSIHHHALDDYNDNMMWALNKAHSFNPFAFALGGGGSGGGNSPFHKSIGGWETKGDGKLVVPLDENGQIARKKEKMKHPFYDLTAKAEKQWNDMVKRQSKSLHDAVREYKRRYGRMPPKGFDKWYQFAVEHDVMLIDEFDQIDHDIAPFLAMPPQALRTRIAQLEDLPTSFHIEILAGDLQIYGPLDEDPRALDVAELIQDFAHLLPDLVMHASGHDTGSQLFAADFRKEAARFVSKGQYLSAENITYYENTRRNPRKTLINACAEDSAAVLQAARNASTTTGTPVEFIHDHRTTMNFCHNPAILEGHGALMFNNARGHKLSPYFVMCKLDNGGELLMPALSGYADRANQKVTPWSLRNDSTIFWRGRTTGNHFNKQHDWRKSHRIQLHTLANTEDGEVAVLVEDQETGLLNRRNFTRAELNKAYMDVGLVGPPTQCQKDGTCKEMAQGINFRPLVAANAGNDKKFALDVDGNGWSQRYQKLLASGSVVLKSTIFPEWNTNWLIPYYHYIPIQHDYSDIYETMAFFAGTPDGKGAHDAMAEKISDHAVEFARNNWRWEDIQAYMFRLLLEYARLSTLDREKMTYKMGGRTAL